MKEAENQIIVYEPNETIRLDVRLENETVWLNRHQMAQLFGRDIKTIGKHIANALSEELASDSSVTNYEKTQSSDNSTVAKFATVQKEGNREVIRQVEYYSLDVVLSVGYRVKSAQGILFRRWANTVLKEYLLRGYSINTRLSQLEDSMHRNLAVQERRIATLEQKVDFFVQTKEPPLQSVFYQGKFWDAKSLLIKFIRRAKKELIVVDAYPGVATLDMLAKRGRGVSIELVTHSNGELAESDFKAFAAQCGKFTKTICGICHDRFIVVDQKEIYWSGASLKDAGRLTFAAAKMVAEVIPGLLDSIRKATTERRDYSTGKKASGAKKGKCD
jgi:hypothetical protein